MKSALILVGTLMAMASAHATTLNLNCSSATAQLSGTLNVDDSGNAAGTLSTTVVTADGTETGSVAFSGTYKVYPAGSYCYNTDMISLIVDGETASGTHVGVKSVRGADCENANGDTIYVNRGASTATCTITK